MFRNSNGIGNAFQGHSWYWSASAWMASLVNRACIGDACTWRWVVIQWHSSQYNCTFVCGPRSDALCVCALDSKNSKDSSKNSGGLKREEEPEEYWSSERERKGESPFKDPLAVIGMVSIMFPFIFLVIASSLGLVDLSPR